MALDIMKERGVPLDRQKFTWREIVNPPFSKLDADAFTRLRVIVMNGIEMESLRFQHSFARMSRELRRELAEVRRTEQHQQTTVNWLLPPDQSPLETTIAYEQVAVELTAAVALQEPDPYMAQVYRFGLLEDYDHLYRYTALLDRLEGKDAQNILQYYTDVTPGRPTLVEHRAPVDDVRESYNLRSAAPITKLNALTILSAEQQTQNYYANIGPLFSDPVARMLYAEIGSIEEQHVTQYESIIDPDESWLEKWLLHEANEVYNYWSCLEQESHPQIKAIWHRFLDYELGHLHHVIELFQRLEGRDAAEILPATLPDRIDYRSHREFVRKVLAEERHLRAVGTRIVDPAEVPESEETLAYRAQMNSEGCPSQIVAAGYQWRPGTTVGKQDGARTTTTQEATP
ncbi:MAG TPA: hypothetical protein VLS89_15465 [Candidatus Nanopelagicales bacterium]|nr:hypothetical protein [Candidatus Nanopelagicales bacterium]